FAPTTRWVERLPFIEPQKHVELLAQRLHARLADGHLYTKIRLEFAQRTAQLRRQIAGLEIFDDTLHWSIWLNSAEQRSREIQKRPQFGLAIRSLDTVKHAKQRSQTYARKVRVLELGVVFVEPFQTPKYRGDLLGHVTLCEFAPRSYVEGCVGRTLLFSEQVF